MRTHGLFAATLLVLVACGGSEDDPGGGLGGSGGAPVDPCAREADFLCKEGCSLAGFIHPSCDAEAGWACPDGWVRDTSCPANNCAGDPAPADRCTLHGWVCEPNGDDLASCPAVLCSSCTGFYEPISAGDCDCACVGGQVVCGSGGVGPGGAGGAGGAAGSGGEGGAGGTGGDVA